MSELIALAKAKPDSISFASPGTGSAPHLVGELFKIVTGIPSPHIPYKGSGPALTALMSGDVDFVFSTSLAAQPTIKSGRVRAMAGTNAKQSRDVPGLQPMAACYRGCHGDDR